jgi:Carboxypeptidase regulatory-like domain/TonB dependent receptor
LEATVKAHLHYRVAGLRLFAGALIAVLFLPLCAMAQLDRGEITGTVEDPTGAVLQNAAIAIINDDTNVRITTKSTATGTYVFDDVIPGKYTVEAEAPGFQKYVVRGVIVQVQQIDNIDVHLATGNVQQSVTVTAAAPLLEAENAQVGQSITNQAVNDLPLATRDWGSLAQMSAGVTTTPTGSGGGGITADAGSSESAYFRVNGVDEWQNDFRLNGINDNIEIYGGNYTLTNAAIVPPPDAIQEFTLQAGDFNAEFGHSTGGIINASLKSGTNGVHGDLWEYVRNDALNANYFFNRTCNGTGCVAGPIPDYHQNLFGFTAGGPVLIPHLINGKNRLFWFADYQGGRFVLPESPGGQNVPTCDVAGATSPTACTTTSEFGSNFTNLQDNINFNSGTYTDALGRVFPNGTILDPASTRSVAAGAADPISGIINTSSKTVFVRDPFFNCTAAGGCNPSNYQPAGPLTGISNFTALTSSLNVLPTSRIDPNAVKVLDLFPLPTVLNKLSSNFPSYIPIEDKNTNTWDVRIDANISPKDILFGVYDRSLLNAHLPGYFPGYAVGQTDARNDSLPAYAWAVGYTRILAPTLTNDMHVGMVHSDKFQQSIYGNTFGIPAMFGIQGVPQVANNGGFPYMNIAGLRGIGVGNYTPTIQTVYSLEGVDAVTKVWRNHTFKTGIDVDDLTANISQPPQGRGDFSFNGMYTDVPNRVSQSGTGLNGIGDILVSPIASLVTPNGATGVDYVGGMNQFSGSNIAATDDHRWYIGVYFQDDWKVNPKLTLNLGLRWDLFTPYAETRGYQANFIAAGGNGPTATYEMSSQGCQVPRAAIFNTVAALSNVNITCNASLATGITPTDDFAPRIGFAYMLRPTLVVRGGFGTAYGALGNLGYGGTLGFNYPFVYTQTVPAPDSNHPLLLAPGQAATMEQSLTFFNFQNPTVLQSPTPYAATVTCPSGSTCDGGEYIGTDYLGLPFDARQNDYQTPLVQTENLTVEDQFSSHDAIQVGYVATQGRHLDILGNTNANSEILPSGTNTQYYVPYPYFSRNSTYETTNAASSYNALQITYEHRMNWGLSLLSNYTWSKCLSDQHAPQNSEYNVGYRAQWLPGFGIAGDYALCDGDAAGLVHVAGTYALPFGRGKQFGSTMSKPADLIVGGWKVNGFYTFQSGQPFTVTCPNATSADFGCAANLTGQSLYSGKHNYTQWMNPAAFAQPPVATAVGQTNFAPLGGPLQQVRGPHFANLDSSILKNFNFTESTFLQFRAEAFNTTNTPPFAQPGQLNFTTSNFSNISATKNSNQNNGARTLQLALKLFY